MSDEIYDFEDNSLGDWSATEDDTDWTVEVNGDAALGGSYGVEISTAAAKTNDGFISKSLDSSYDDIYVKFKMKLSDGFTNSTGNPGYLSFLSFCQSTIFNIIDSLEIRFQDDTIYLRDGTGDNLYEITGDTEYEIQCRFVIDGTSGGMQVWIDGELEIDDLNYDTGTSDVGFLRLGLYTSSWTVPSGDYVYLDDIEIADAYISDSAGVLERMLMNGGFKGIRNL